MKMELQSVVSIIFLSITNVCICVQDLAEKTFNSISDNYAIKGNNNNPSHIHRHDNASVIVQQHQHHANQQHYSQWGYGNFILVDYLADGEMERRLSYNGITAKETTIGNSTSKSLSLWQLSNGKAFIQMIYSMDDELIDCEYVRQKSLVHSFLRKFYNEVHAARKRNFTTPLYVQNNNNNNNPATMKSYVTDREFDRFIDSNFLGVDVTEIIEINESSEHDNNDAFGWRNLQYKDIRNSWEDIPDDLKPLLNYKLLKQQCDAKQKQTQSILKDLNSEHQHERINATEQFERKKRSLSDWLMVPNTKWCGKGHNAAEYIHLGGLSKADRCCRKHDHCKLIIHAMSSKYHLFNFRPFTISHCKCDLRKRRDLSNILRIPGTKWCGKGYTAKTYSEIGGFSKADRCCRQHDKSCPFWITGFATKYGLFNWRISTLMHCKCDERFRTCLKMANSPDANMVGKLFFNIVQTKCFVLKPERVCKKRSYWGGDCERKGYRKRAHLQDNRSF